VIGDKSICSSSSSSSSEQESDKQEDLALMGFGVFWTFCAPHETIDYR